MSNPVWPYLLVFGCGYLTGSCPTGYLVGRAHGIDIRTRGSGNIGATNVLRIFGKPWGYLVFALDALKGFLAVRLAIAVGATTKVGLTNSEIIGLVGGLACILGHTFPIWLKFRGGKGVATSAGVLLGLMPLATVSVFLVWAILFRITRYVSVASIIAAGALPIFVAFYLHIRLLSSVVLLPFSLLISALVIWRHRSNVRRLFQGTEQRFGEK